MPLAVLEPPLRVRAELLLRVPPLLKLVKVEEEFWLMVVEEKVVTAVRVAPLVTRKVPGPRRNPPLTFEPEKMSEVPVGTWMKPELRTKSREVRVGRV